jgi:hypothetical protein
MRAEEPPPVNSAIVTIVAMADSVHAPLAAPVFGARARGGDDDDANDFNARLTADCIHLTAYIRPSRRWCRSRFAARPQCQVSGNYPE